MKYSQYGNRSLTDIKDRYKSYIKQIIGFLSDTLQAFKLKQEDLVEIKDNITDHTNQEKFEEVWSALGKLNLQRRAFYDMVHINLITYFEAFNKDFFLKVYLSKPKLLLKKNKAIKKGEKDKMLDYREILNLSTYEEIVFHMAYEQVESYGHLNIDKLNDELVNKFDLDLSKNFDAWEELRENYYRRNVVVHNKSQVSKIYADKMGCPEEIGHGLRNNPKYIRGIRSNLDKYIDFIYDTITTKLNI